MPNITFFISKPAPFESRGIFAGGHDGNFTDVIEYITINSIGDAQDFGDLTTATEQIAACSNA